MTYCDTSWARNIPGEAAASPYWRPHSRSWLAKGTPVAANIRATTTRLRVPAAGGLRARHERPEQAQDSSTKQRRLCEATTCVHSCKKTHLRRWCSSSGNRTRATVVKEQYPGHWTNEVLRADARYITGKTHYIYIYIYIYSDRHRTGVHIIWTFVLHIGLCEHFQWMQTFLKPLHIIWTSVAQTISYGPPLPKQYVRTHEFPAISFTLPG